MAGLFTLVFAIGGWRVGLSRLSDNSFFWHLRTGRHILDHGIPHEDIYSFTASGRRWVAQSWLAEVLYGTIDKVVGTFGVRLLTGFTGAAVAAVTYRLVHRLSRDRLAAVGLTLAAIGASFTLWSARHLFLGILAFLGLLWIVEVPGSWLGRRAIWTALRAALDALLQQGSRVLARSEQGDVLSLVLRRRKLARPQLPGLRKGNHRSALQRSDEDRIADRPMRADLRSGRVRAVERRGWRPRPKRLRRHPRLQWWSL